MSVYPSWRRSARGRASDETNSDNHVPASRRPVRGASQRGRVAASDRGSARRSPDEADRLPQASPARKLRHATQSGLPEPRRRGCCLLLGRRLAISDDSQQPQGGDQQGGQQQGGQQREQQAPQQPQEPQIIQMGMSTDQVKAASGTPEKIVNLGPKQIYV